MKIVVITLPDFVPHEAQTITRLLDSDAVWRVHLRKPGCTASDMLRLIMDIPAGLRHRLTLHDHHHLAAHTGVGGVHLNSRNPIAPAWAMPMVSRSCHSIAEAASSAEDYHFLSPIFNSVSKPGYSAAFAHDELRHGFEASALSRRTFALGGVTPERLSLLSQIGFGGAAMLGAAWSMPPDRLISLLGTYTFAMTKHEHLSRNFRLQLITDGLTPEAHVEGARRALAGGCRWVQLRMKDSTPSTLLTTGQQIAELCRLHDATFIIDDHVELVEALGADGVHLGLNDMSPDAARRILGPERIIGATANTAADVERGHRLGADYIGLGPYRFTTTKKNLSAVLGLEGYNRIMTQARSAGIEIPVTAIGGITAADVKDIMRTGVDGVAVSGGILRASDPAEATRHIINELTTL